MAHTPNIGTARDVLETLFLLQDAGWRVVIDRDEHGRVVVSGFTRDMADGAWQQDYERLCLLVHEHLDAVGLDPAADVEEVGEALRELVDCWRNYHGQSVPVLTGEPQTDGGE